jgi:hypothetical protein
MFGTSIDAMVALLVTALVVVPVAFGVAARADAKVRGLSQSRVPDPDPRRSVADVDERRDQWRQLATRAWLICCGASLVAVAVVGVLICVG